MKGSKKIEVELRKELYALTVNIEEAKKKDKLLRRKLSNSNDKKESTKIKEELYNINVLINLSKRRLKEIRTKLELLKVYKGKVKVYKLEEI